MAHKYKHLAIMLAAAGLLTACGGGGDSTPAPEPVPEPKVKAVKVMGDSLSDSGTLGFKFTVQGKDSEGKPFQVWAERVASQYKIELCPHYRSQSPDMTGYTEDPSCSNFAIGGAQINPVAVSTGAVISTPHSIVRQIQDVAAAGVAADDLLLVAGGSNDAATLIEYFLELAQGKSMPLMMLLASRIDAPTLDALLQNGEEGLVQAGVLYMQEVAALLAASVKTELLDKGAQHVAMLNVPAITMTPEFAAVLKQIEAAQGTAKADMLQAVFDGWVQTFNAALAAAVKDESRIELVDFYTSFVDQVSSPGKYGYRNTTLPVCSVLNVADDIYNCGADRLAQNIPHGETSAEWWQSYMFSNAFHPTPYGHQQMGVIMQDALKAKGWQP